MCARRDRYSGESLEALTWSQQRVGIRKEDHSLAYCLRRLHSFLGVSDRPAWDGRSRLLLACSPRRAHIETGIRIRTKKVIMLEYLLTVILEDITMAQNRICDST